MELIQRLRDGDRYWFENHKFQADDLAAIRATTLKDVILRNSSITTLPASVFTTQAAPQGFGSGGGAATDMMLWVIARDLGQQLADDIAARLVIDAVRDGRTSQRRVSDMRFETANGPV